MDGGCAHCYRTFFVVRLSLFFLFPISVYSLETLLCMCFALLASQHITIHSESLISETPLHHSRPWWECPDLYDIRRNARDDRTSHKLQVHRELIYVGANSSSCRITRCRYLQLIQIDTELVVPVPDERIQEWTGSG